MAMATWPVRINLRQFSILGHLYPAIYKRQTQLDFFTVTVRFACGATRDYCTNGQRQHVPPIYVSIILTLLHKALV